MPFPPKLKTSGATEFSQNTGIGLTKTNEMMADGILETVQVGKRRLIVLDSWDRYLRENLSKPCDTPQNGNHHGRSPAEPSPGDRALKRKCAPAAATGGSFSGILSGAIACDARYRVNRRATGRSSKKS